jgi:hypothetical protein
MENQILDLAVVMPLKRFRKLLAQHPKTIPMSFWIDQREIIAGNKQLVFIEFDICLHIKCSMRKLFGSVINSSFITGWCSWSYWFCLSLRLGKQYTTFRSVMLIGLLAKNALIVEFAIQRRRNGKFNKAAIEGRAR